jgi:hypothetical protein
MARLIYPVRVSASPTLEGFRAAFRRPSFTLAEITWRWAVGATAVLLFFFGLFEFLSTVPVTNGELLFMRTRQPILVWQAILHILRGSLDRSVLPAILAAMMMASFWIIAASIGRAVTVPAMIEYFRRRVAGDRNSSPFRSLARLNFLRIATLVAAGVGFLGSAILASLVSPDKNPQPALAFLVFLPFAAASCFFCWLLNWFLSLAGIFAVRDGEDAIGAISAAATFCRERLGAVLAVSTWTGLAHIVVFVIASTVASTLLGVSGLLPWRLVVLAVIAVTLLYFAVADWLYMARLAGYLFIAEMPELLSAQIAAIPPSALSAMLVATTVDRDELILSDVPNPFPWAEPTNFIWLPSL